MKPKKQPKLERIYIIGQFDDGTFRQIFIGSMIMNVVLQVIVGCEGTINASETVLEGFYIKEEQK